MTSPSTIAAVFAGLTVAVLGNDFSAPPPATADETTARILREKDALIEALRQQVRMREYAIAQYQADFQVCNSMLPREKRL